MNDLNNKINLLQEKINKNGSVPCHAAGSCAEILRNNVNSSSGYYWVENAVGHPHRVYCDMTRSCGGVTGGWMRVAHLDMTNSSHQCPSTLRQRTGLGKRTCVTHSNASTCSSILHPSRDIHYSKLCGSIRGYNVGTMNAFDIPTQSIENYYVDGISLTHGGAPRHHIWTFAVNHNNECPCGNPPAIVGDDYFCDVGTHHFIDLNDPLWDGENCGSNTCCTFNNPPWFYKQLPRPTADNIEMRVCRDQDHSNEDVLIETVEIYVHRSLL